MNVTITVSGLRRSFGSTTALDGVDLQIGTGVTGLLGPNGAGKTTLLRILATAAGPDQGEVRILGHDPQTTEGRLAVRRLLGFVPQEPFLIAASVRENIDMGRGLTDAEIEAAARAAHAHDFIAKLDGTYDTPLGEGGARLSVGQKQLLAIARALAGKPHILFLDEATSHMDSETERVVQRTLDGLRGTVTVVAIAHRLSTIRGADRIAVLNHGHVAELGRHDELMKRPDGIYRRLYELQQIEEREVLHLAQTR